MLRPNAPEPGAAEDKWRLYRSLVNRQMPGTVHGDFLCLQDEMLKALLLERGAIEGMSLPASPLDARLSLWKGDITRLSVDAIVNAANEELLGCFIPCHGCIDNAIHTYAGMQLREACSALMQAQGHSEPIGRVKITPGYNLPSQYVLYTVGPTVKGALTQNDRDALASCYRSCLRVASENKLRSIAFCCISTGVFRFPKPEAAQIAVETVCSYLNTQPTTIQRVIFNVYEQSDDVLYRKLLGVN